jgi:hypothetical protein
LPEPAGRLRAGVGDDDPDLHAGGRRRFRPCAGRDARLDRLKAATAALSDPRRTTPAQAEEILATARPISCFKCGLHADETGRVEMAMDLVHRLAVSEQPMIRGIRGRVPTLVNPVAGWKDRALSS